MYIEIYFYNYLLCKIQTQWNNNCKKKKPNTEMDSGGKTISVEEAALLLQEPTGEHFSLYH